MRIVRLFFGVAGLLFGCLVPGWAQAEGLHTVPVKTGSTRLSVPWDSSQVIWPMGFSTTGPGITPALWGAPTGGETAAQMTLAQSPPYHTTVQATADPNSECAVVSEPIVCDVGVNNLIEMRVCAVVQHTFWKMSLLSGGREYELMESDALGTTLTGASGTFTFAYAQKLGWTGIKTFSLKLTLLRDSADISSASMDVDYICVFHDSNAQYYYWREDFVGAANNPIPCWSDVNYDSTYDAVLTYSNNPSQGRITRTLTSDWGKVLGPTITLNTSVYHKLVLTISYLDPGTDMEVNLYIKPQWYRLWLGSNHQDASAQRRRRVGTYVFDFYQSNWDSSLPAVNQVFPELIVEGPVGAYAEIDSVGFFKDGLTLPPEPAHTLSYEGFASPNPFVPTRGQTTFFYLNDSPPLVTVKIFNIKGRKIRTLSNTLEWDGRDDSGRYCEGGLYIFQIEASGKRRSGQVVLIH
jgi:hypothetical protein